MTTFAREYTDLDHALDEVHSLLDEWVATKDAAAAPDDETIHYTQLVLHEWIANLVQHADFGERAPNLQIRLSAENRHVTCAVIDNSEGFDLTEKIPADGETTDDLPEGGMGLRIIDACTDPLSYTCTGSGRHRLEFSIPADHDPWLSTIF